MSQNQRQIEEIIDQWSDDDEADGEQDPYESSDDELFDYVPELGGNETQRCMRKK